MTEPEELLAASEEPRREVAYVPLLLEPKEEPPHDDFLSTSDAIAEKLSNHSAGFLKKPKDEPLDLSFSYDNELNVSDMGDKECKKEELPGYDYMLSHDGVANKTEEAEFSSLFHVEPKLEVLEDRVVIAVENPNGLKFFDDSNDEATLVDNNVGRPDRYSKDEKFASSYGLPVSAHDIVEMSTIDLKQLLKTDSLSELQREIIRKIRKRGNNRRATASFNQRRKTEGPIKKLAPKSDSQWFNNQDQKLIDNSFATPQCILCEKYPSSMYAYTSHLYNQHNSTLKTNQVFLQCSCGTEVYYNTNQFEHRNKCAGIEFSLLQLKNTSTPQCILCERHPSDAYVYAQHLATHHKYSLNANNLHLLCSCGEQIRSSERSINHNKECDASQFTVKNDFHAVPVDILHSDSNVD